MRFSQQFLSELRCALLDEGRDDLAAQVNELTIHQSSSMKRPVAQFIYTVPRTALPSSGLPELILPVPGLFCLFVVGGRIVAIETLGRDVLEP